MLTEPGLLNPTETQYQNPHQFLFENNPQPLWILDAATRRFLAVNTAAERLYGFSKTEFLSMTMGDLEDSNAASSGSQGRLFCSDDRAPGREWKHRTRDGNPITVELACSPIEAGSRGSVLVVCRDLTARKRVEARLAVRYVLTRTLGENSPDTLGKILQILGSGLGFAAAELWLNEDSAAGLARSAVWRSPDLDAKGLDSIRGRLGTWLRAGVLGGVWTSGYPLWTPEVWSDPGSRDDSIRGQAGIQSALAFPIRAAGLCGGVIVLFSRESVRPDEPMFELIADIGSQIGHYVQGVRTTQALRASEDRLRLAVERLSIGTWELDPHSDRSQCSEQLLRLYGISGARTGFSWDEWVACLHPDDRERMVAEMQEAFEKCEPTERDYRVVWPDGSVHWLRSMTGVLFDAQGRPGRIVGLDFDITERKRIEERLRILSSAVEQSPASILITDLSGRIEYANARAAEVTGYTPDELIGQNPRILKSGETPPGEYQRLWAMLAAGGEWRGLFHNRKKNGDLFWETASIRAILDDSGAPSHYLAVKEDVTERRALDAALQVSEERFRLAASCSSDVIYEWDILSGQTRIFGGNRGRFALALADHPTTSEGYNRLVHPDDLGRLNASVARHLETGERFSEQYRLVLPSGEVRHVVDEGAAVRDKQGKAYKWIGVLRDITEREKVESALAASRAKNDFLSRMSHELRTPLNAILGFGQLLELETLRPRQQESVDQILKGGRHLLTLVDEVLDIARIESGRLALSSEPVLTEEAVEAAMALIHPLAESKQIEMCRQSSADWKQFVTADRSRLQQVLLNLLSNAVKYNRDRGRITVSCSAKGDRLRIEVQDTGIGIPAAKVGLLFRPFERLGAEATQVQGTGIGLVLSQQLTEAMGGTLGFETVQGEGSTFWIELPIAPAAGSEVQAAPPGASAEPPSSNAAIVLYVEDNSSNTLLMERILGSRPDIKLVTAVQGRLGLELARYHNPRLILLDLHLPDMPGDAVLQHLQADPLTAAIPVAMISADALSNQAARLRAAGAREYFTKPLEVQQLLRFVDKTLSMRSGKS